MRASFSKAEQQEMMQSMSVQDYIEERDRTPSGVFLSLVIPSYNEEKRLPVMLNKTLRVRHHH